MELSSFTWWALKTQRERAQALIARCGQAVDDNAARKSRAIVLGSLFESIGLTSLSDYGASLIDAKIFKDCTTPIIRNVARSIVSTCHSKLFALDAPLPMALSNGGDWEQREKARDIDQLLECEYKLPQGQFSTTNDAWNHAGLIAMASTGTAGIVAKPGYDQVETSITDTLTMGLDLSGRWGSVRSAVHTTWMDPEEAVFCFPKKFKDAILRSVEDIEDPLNVTRLTLGLTQRQRQQIRLYEGWRSAARGEDGRYMLVLKDGTVLQDNAWKRAGPPVVLWHWERQLGGMWGTPLTHILFHETLALNEMLADVLDAEHNSPQSLLVHDKSTATQLSQVFGWQKVEVEMPGNIQAIAFDKYHRQALPLIAELDASLHQNSGVSEAQAGGTKARGTTSGRHENLVAMYFNERFADHQRRALQAKVIDTSKVYLWCLQDMVADPKKSTLKRRWRDQKNNRYHELSVSDLDLDDSAFVMEIAPVSEDKNSPAARADKADNMLRLNLIDGTTWLEAQSALDTDQAQEDADAERDWIDQQITRWERDPVDSLAESYQSPTKWIDFAGAARHVARRQLKVQNMGIPQKRLDFFTKFCDECAELEQQEQENAPKTTESIQAPPPTGVTPPSAAQQ